MLKFYWDLSREAMHKTVNVQFSQGQLSRPQAVSNCWDRAPFQDLLGLSAFCTTLPSANTQSAYYPVHHSMFTAHHKNLSYY
jgi:hypothetical protein